MSSEQWQRVDRIFVEALSLSPENRERFVAREAAHDPAVAREALELLTAAEQSGQFMETPAAERLARRLAADGWRLRPGERVGAYVVTDMLGAGGNGEVWRARDDRLGRDVAIKVLLPHVSTDPGQLNRFADEARTASALNHANLVTIHDVGEHNGVPFLVSECLEGQSLRQRMSAGPIRVDDVVAIALGIAAGLGAAHRRGIVHRDLKPENVFLRSEGGVKILDFGLAKLQLVPAAPAETLHAVSSVIAGTAGYMAPEQVRGEDVDARADLFSLGVMLYEMLANEHPFRKDSTFGTLQAILDADPANLTTSARPIPTQLIRIVMRLLEKNPAGRFQSASDLAWALEQSVSIDTDATAPAAPGSLRRRRIGLALTATAALGAAVWLLLGRTPATPVTDAEVTRFTWTLPSGVSLGSPPAVAPDGRNVAFSGWDGARSRLYLRSLNAFDAAPIEGSEGARLPFWSPDNRWVGFFARGRVMKVSIAGGAPVAIADDRHVAAGNRRTEAGGTWSKDGVLVFAPNFNPPSLVMVPATGGVPAPVTRLVSQRGENQHRFPFFLPDGRHFLYLARASALEGRGVFVGSVERAGGEGVRVLDVESNAVYTPLAGADLGVLLYVANGRIEAQRFDPSRRTLVGSAQPLGIEAGGPTLFHPAALGASANVLAYSTQFGAGHQIRVASADGRTPRVLHDRQEQQWPRISPDGRRMAWLLIDPREPNADIWVEDLARRTRTRVTTAPTRDLGHVWSPDGLRLAYRPDVDDRKRLSIIAADGSGASQDLTCPMSFCEPTDWSSDGRELIVNAYERDDTDVWAVAIAPGGNSRPLLQTRFNERDARVSPDRRWIAYVSDEGGRPEVSVRSLSGSPRRFSVSPGGGDQVVWQRDGRALYYVDPKGRLQNVSVHDQNGQLSLGQPVEMPLTIGAGHSNTQYDLAPDGRIYYLDPTPPSLPTDVRIVLGWQALLK